MSNEEIAELITEFMDGEVEQLGDTDWMEVLEEVMSNIKNQLQAKQEEQENANG